MSIKTYEDGLRDGKVLALEQTVYKDHKPRLDAHAQRLQKIERLIWGAYGVVATFQFVPELLDLLRLAMRKRGLG